MTLAGQTAKGRKGTSWGRVRQLSLTVDDPGYPTALCWGFPPARGCSTKCGMRLHKLEPVRQRGRSTGQYDEVLLDGVLTTNGA